MAKNHLILSARVRGHRGLVFLNITDLTEFVQAEGTDTLFVSTPKGDQFPVQKKDLRSIEVYDED